MIATALDHFTAPPCSRLLGWHLLDARPNQGWVRIGFDGKADFCNPAGFIQGGILSAMLDDTMGPAVFVMTEGRLYTATITMTVNFLSPARPGPIFGEADVNQLGKTVAFVAARLMTADGTVLATATSSARLVETAKAIQQGAAPFSLHPRSGGEGSGAGGLSARTIGSESADISPTPDPKSELRSSRPRHAQERAGGGESI